MTKPPLKACVLVPAYNEARNIGAVVREIRDYCPDVIVIDDGSADETGQAAAGLGQTFPLGVPAVAAVLAGMGGLVAAGGFGAGHHVVAVIALVLAAVVLFGPGDQASAGQQDEPQSGCLPPPPAIGLHLGDIS